MSGIFMDLSPVSDSSQQQVSEISTSISDLVKKNLADILSEVDEVSFSEREFSPIPFDLESSDDSGIGSLDGTTSSFLSDTVNSPRNEHEILAYDSSGFLLHDTSRLSSPDSISPLSFSPGSPVAKQLSFDSSFSSPSSPEVDLVKPKHIFFDDNFDISSAIEDISEEAPVFSGEGEDSMCASPTFSQKDRSRRAKSARVQRNESSLTCSISNDTIKTAFHKEDSNDGDLVGDFSRQHSLPIVPGKHQDLKSITADTLAELLTGIRLPNVDYKIVDCRYPYEYDGGHIDGALNLHTQDQIQSFIEESMCNSTSSATILIFHCEFSSERGPKRARFLRSLDREINAEFYPMLTFPEIYILDGGYKEFFNQYPDLCCPEDYIPMLHTQFRDELKKYRSKAKSWKAGKKSIAVKTKIQFKY